MNVSELSPLFFSPKRVWYNQSHNHKVYEDGWEVEMLKVIDNTLNMSLDIVNYRETMLIVMGQEGKEAERLICQPFILVGWVTAMNYEMDYFSEYTRNYFSIRFAW